MTNSSGPFSDWQNIIDNPPASSDSIDEQQMGGLPLVFQFSQGSLQDYEDCARRFQLRYVLGQRWPAARSEPLDEQERAMQLGSQFHMLIQRHVLGIPAEQLTPDDPEIRQWWQAYLNHPPPDLPSQKLPEVQLSTVVATRRVLARYDMLAIEPGERVIIVDWKTARVRPKRQTLAQRMQTKIYPYVLVEAGKSLFGGPLLPEQVTFIYWFANDPKNPEIFTYNSALHQRIHTDIVQVLEELSARNPETVWPLTDDELKCKYCVYRSLCDRGIRAGSLDDAEMDVVESAIEFGFDLDTVDEIAF